MSSASLREVERYVLDSWALLAYLEEEPGHERVVEMLERALEGNCGLLMSWINVGEVVCIVERERGLPEAQETLARLSELPIELVEPDRNQVLAAAHFKAGLSIAYADCFALALAHSREAAVVTGDPEFQKANGVVPLEWLPTTTTHNCT